MLVLPRAELPRALLRKLRLASQASRISDTPPCGDDDPDQHQLDQNNRGCHYGIPIRPPPAGIRQTRLGQVLALLKH